jgi:fumarate hydratase class II
MIVCVKEKYNTLPHKHTQHISAYKQATKTLTTLQELAVEVTLLATKHKDDVKMGRTHLQDALPVTIGQEWSGYAAQLGACIDSLRRSLQQVAEQVPVCATAVGTGVNAAEGLEALLLPLLREYTGIPGLRVANNLFASLSSCDTLVALHGALKQTAVVLNKLANDVRLSASGPRGGLGEISLSSDEHGSSIMPGKVNPTQCEAVTQVCLQVFGNDVAVTMAGASGQFQLNAYRPVIIHNVLESCSILAGCAHNFNIYCIQTMTLNTTVMRKNAESSVANLAVLNTVVGYDFATKVAEQCVREGLSLGEAVRANAKGNPAFSGSEVLEVVMKKLDPDTMV